MKVGILEDEFLDPSILAQLRKVAEVEVFHNGSLPDFLKDKEAVIVRLRYKLDASCLDPAKRLKFILSATTGLNHIDLNYTEARGIQVISLKGETEFLKNVRATAEHTLGLALALLRHYPSIFAADAAHLMDRRLFFGSELYEMKVGLIGLGRIGSLVKNYLTEFGCHLTYFDPIVHDPSVKRSATLQELISDSKLIILMASYSSDNDGMIDRDLLHLMKGRYFINTARGELVDEEALMELLENEHFRGVALDVIRNEQGRNNLERLLALKTSKRLILSPHVGGATFDSLRKAEAFVVDKWFRTMQLMQS